MDEQLLYHDRLTVRFAGDSGDGMQLVGVQFSNTSASVGLGVNTFPDYPSEIRAPEGTLYGVSAFQLQLGAKEVTTPGDEIDVLVAMNPAALKVNLPNLKKNGVLIVNSSSFNSKNLKLAGYEISPLENGTLENYQTIIIDLEKELKEALKTTEASPKTIRHSKNFFALGVAYQLFDLPMENSIKWIKKKFAKDAEVLQTNLSALQAGWNYALRSPDIKKQYKLTPIALEKGYYRNITGNQAVALALVAASEKAQLPLFLGSYPITPATDILQYISGYKNFGIRHLQAEDEIAGISSAIGAAFGGNLAVTTTSGPGLSLKIEALGLAVMTELPLVIVDVMRAGPSTGLPTKPEQSDLFQALYGRHGEAPLPVLAAASASDCFAMTFEACRISLKYMTPVILLTDGYIAQGSEPWKIPSLKDLPDISIQFADNPEVYAPYKRDPETLARMWAVPGQKGMDHRIGGLEKKDITGEVSHDPLNHQKMTALRKQKVDNISNDIPPAKVEGNPQSDLLVVTWGSTYGATRAALDQLHEKGHQIAHVHLRYLNPLPKNLGDILRQYATVVVPELNSGQLREILQARFLKPVKGINKVQGSPFKSVEIERELEVILNG